MPRGKLQVSKNDARALVRDLFVAGCTLFFCAALVSFLSSCTTEFTLSKTVNYPAVVITPSARIGPS